MEHDLYAQTVDLAIGYTLPAAEAFNPPLTVSLAIHSSTVAYSNVVVQFDSIGHCNAIPATNLYRETNQNKTFPYANTTVGGSSNSTASTGGSKQSSGTALNVAISLSAAITSLLAFVSLL